MKLENGKCRRNLISRMTFRLPSDEKIGLKFMLLLYIYIYIYIYIYLIEAKNLGYEDIHFPI